MKQTLRQKVNAAILISFLLIAVIFIVIQLPYHQRSMESAVRQNERLLKSMVERDQDLLANEIYEDRKRAIVIRLAQMSQVEGILNIVVYDSAGRILVVHGRNSDPSDLSLENTPKPPANTFIHQGRLGGNRTLIYIQAIEIINERIGFIRIDYSLAEIERQQELSYWIFGGLLGSILVIMLVLLNYILSKVVIHPITFLREAMLRMKTGALGDQIEVQSTDEIGDLTTTFNQMSTDLALSYRQIEAQNQNLRESEKRLSEEREQMAMMRIYLKNIIDSMPSMLISINIEGIILEWNEAASRTTGIPPIKAIGREIWEVMPIMEKYRDSINTIYSSRTPMEFHREIISSGENEAFQNIALFPLSPTACRESSSGWMISPNLKKKSSSSGMPKKWKPSEPSRADWLMTSTTSSAESPVPSP